MSTSVWEHFLGIDWERYSQIASKGTCVGCFGIGILTIVSNYGFLLGLWVLFAGLFLAIIEFPGVFSFIPNFEGYQNFFLETLLLKLDEVKAIACFSLSLFCFRGSALPLMAGLALLLTAILLAFSAINKRADEATRNEAGQDHGAHSSHGFVNLNTPMSGLNSNNFNQQSQSFQSAPKYQPVAPSFNDGQINPHTGFASQKQGVVLGSYQNNV